MKTSLLWSYIGLSIIGVSFLPAVNFASSPNRLSTARDFDIRLESDIPSVIKRGFEQFEQQNALEAFDAWVEGSFLEELPSSPRYQFGELIEMVGDFEGYTVIGNLPVTNHNQIVYVETQHERASFFWSFTVYETSNEHLVTDIKMNSDPLVILPPYLAFSKLTPARYEVGYR